MIENGLCAPYSIQLLNALTEDMQQGPEAPPVLVPHHLIKNGLWTSNTTHLWELVKKHRLRLHCRPESESQSQQDPQLIQHALLKLQKTCSTTTTNYSGHQCEELEYQDSTLPYWAGEVATLHSGYEQDSGTKLLCPDPSPDPVCATSCKLCSLLWS